MDILIKGMEIPKDGEKLYIITFSDGKACASYKPFEWHDVVPVPPHGDLIGADELFKEMERKEWYDNADRDIAEDLVLAAPIIIPAEEETC